jgi:CelD/BcsL family acetyltransferase involved in cellulose biosynthesis
MQRQKRSETHRKVFMSVLIDDTRRQRVTRQYVVQTGKFLLNTVHRYTRFEFFSAAGVDMSQTISNPLIADSFESLEAEKILDEWDRLAAAMPTQMPFQTLQWNRTWWLTFRRRGTFVNDKLHLICVKQDGRLLGIIPLFRTTIGLAGIPFFRFYRLLGADSNLTEWRSVICRPEHRQLIQSLWLKEMSRSCTGFSYFQIRGFSAQEISSIKEEYKHLVKGETPSENFVLALGDNWDTFKATRKRNIKESLRHCYNSLTRYNLIPSLEVIGDACEIEQKMALFYQWHSLRANNNNTVSHPDYFKNAKHRKFLDLLAKGLCGQGQLKLFELKLNDKSVAYRFGFISGNTLYLYLSAYDPEFSKLSTMTTLVAEMIKWAIEKKMKFVNLSFGRDSSKSRWGPSEVQFFDTWIGNDGGLIPWLNRWILNAILNRKRGE